MGLKNVSLHDIPFDLFVKYFNLTNTSPTKNKMRDRGTSPYEASVTLTLKTIFEEITKDSISGVCKRDYNTQIIIDRFSYLNHFFSSEETILDASIEKIILNNYSMNDFTLVTEEEKDFLEHISYPKKSVSIPASQAIKLKENGDISYDNENNIEYEDFATSNDPFRKMEKEGDENTSVLMINDKKKNIFFVELKIRGKGKKVFLFEVTSVTDSNTTIDKTTRKKLFSTVPLEGKTSPGYANATIILYPENTPLADKYTPYKNYSNLSRDLVLRYVVLEERTFNLLYNNSLIESNAINFKLNENWEIFQTRELDPTYSGFITLAEEKYVPGRTQYYYKDADGKDIGLLIIGDPFIIPEISPDGKIVYDDKYGLPTTTSGYDTPIEDHARQMRRLIFGRDFDWNIIYNTLEGETCLVQELDKKSLKYWTELKSNFSYEDSDDEGNIDLPLTVCTESTSSRKFINEIFDLSALPEKKAIAFMNNGKLKYEVEGNDIKPVTIDIITEGGTKYYKFSDSENLLTLDKAKAEGLVETDGSTGEIKSLYSKPYRLKVYERTLQLPNGKSIELGPTSVNADMSFVKVSIETVIVKVVEVVTNIISTLLFWWAPTVKEKIVETATKTVRQLTDNMQGEFGRATIFDRGGNPYILCELLQSNDKTSNFEDTLYLNMTVNGVTVFTKEMSIERDSNGVPISLTGSDGVKIAAEKESSVISRNQSAILNRSEVIIRLFKLPLGKVKETFKKECIAKLKEEKIEATYLSDYEKNIIKGTGITMYGSPVSDFKYGEKENSEDINYDISTKVSSIVERAAVFLSADSEISTYSMKELDLNYLTGSEIKIPEEIFNKDALGFREITPNMLTKLTDENGNVIGLVEGEGEEKISDYAKALFYIDSDTEEIESEYQIYEKVTNVRNAEDPSEIKKMYESVYCPKSITNIRLPSTEMSAIVKSFMNKELFISDDYVLGRGSQVKKDFPHSEQKTLLKSLLKGVLEEKNFLNRDSFLFNNSNARKMLEFAKGYNKVLMSSDESFIEKNLEDIIPERIASTSITLATREAVEEEKIENTIDTSIVSLSPEEIPNVYQRLLLYEKYATTSSLLDALLTKKYAAYLSSMSGEKVNTVRDSNLNFFISNGKLRNVSKQYYQWNDKLGVYNENRKPYHELSDDIRDLSDKLVRALISFVSRDASETSRMRTIQELKDVDILGKIKGTFTKFKEELEKEKEMEEEARFLPEISVYSSSCIDCNFTEIIQKLNLKETKDDLIWGLHE